MSQTKTDLANESMMLIRVKGKLNDLESDTEPNALIARMYFDAHVDELLEEFSWKAFMRTNTLADITDSQPPPADWAYRYVWPPDCLAPRQILIEGYIKNQTPIPFDVEMLADASLRSILCDQASVSLRYTSNEFKQQVDKWPHNFRRAVVYRLASSLATAIKENATLATTMMQFYVDSLRVARYVDEAGRLPGPSQTPTALRRRRGSLT
jgi:hypothetical protein